MWYGDDGQWQYYGNTYVVQRPIVNNFSGGPITIDNPAANKATLSYTLDGNPYTIAPGYSQEFTEDRAWVVQFSRGATSIRADMGSSRACIPLPVRTMVGNCIVANSRKL